MTNQISKPKAAMPASAHPQFQPVVSHSPAAATATTATATRSRINRNHEVLRLEDVTKVYDMGPSKVRALDHADLTVHEGELLCIVGPSGSGKSTLLHIMGLLDTPSSGLRYIDGIETARMNEAQQARVRGKKIGFVFQRFNLIPSLTAVENVALPLVLCAECNDRTGQAKKILESLDMGDRLNHYPSQLSGGQTQRVAIARALINNPEIILADEPTGNLDSKTGGEVIGIFKRLHAEGRTIVFITHDESLTSVADRIIRIRDGRVLDPIHPHKS